MGEEFVLARAAAILIEDGKVALIERQRADRVYYVFPGGGTEYGEWPTETAKREVEEELGLTVKVKRMVAEVVFNSRPQYFFLVERVGGEFGTGQGEEMSSPLNSQTGSYTPVWLPIQELACRTVYPESVVNLVKRSLIEGWPEEPRRFYEYKQR